MSSQRFSEYILDTLPRPRLGELFEQVPAFIVWMRGPNHVVEGLNHAARRLIGFRDVIGQPMADALPELAKQGLVTVLDRVLATGEPFEARGLRLALPAMPGATADERHLNLVYRALVEPDGTRSGVLCHGVDVTAEVQATAALQESESHHRQVLDSLPVIVYRAEPTPPHETIYVNRAVESLGFTYEEWLSRPDMWESRLHPDDRIRVRRETREALERATPMDSRYRVIARDGSVRWFHDRGEFVPDREGIRCVWQGIMLDITALRESEERQRLIFEEAGIGMAVCLLNGQIEHANEALCELLGYSADELRRMRYHDVTFPEDLPADAEATRRLFAGESRRFSGERRYVRRDGTLVWGMLTVTLLRDASGTPVRRIAQVQDITERRRAELALAQAQAALRESEERYRHIVANAPGMVYQYVVPAQGDGYFSFVSEGARSMFGVAPEDAMKDARLLLDLVHPEERAEFSRLARQAAIDLGSFRWEGRILLGTGEVRYVQIVARDQGKPDGTVLSDGLIIDVTERRLGEQRLRDSEEQLRHTQKMEAVGRLAGGVAHDFNNLITIIRASAGFLLEDTTDADPRHDDVQQIATAADRAAALTRQLLSFSRRQPLNQQQIDLNEIVANLRPMLSRVIGEHIAVSVHLHESPVGITADVGQLEQVLINLAINARDAMPEGGRLGMDIDVVTLDTDAARTLPSHDSSAAPGRYGRLVVWDNGAGMTREVCTRAFEPFYTTKEAGRGTGLGLATVYGAVKQWGGFVRLESAPGEGTVVELYVPMLPEQAPVADAAPVGSAALAGSETILLVEDEAGLRTLAQRILERQGYAVLVAGSGTEAVQQAAAHDGEIHLLLSDMVMPGLDGRAVAERIRRDRPSAAVLFMSGYADDDAPLRGALAPGTPYIQKPFAPAELLRVVRETLDARSCQHS